jgi:glycosyltransferase involved in cell wall biosynthesis
MSSKLLASIIVPTYKRTQLLNSALSSLCFQTCQDKFEIIVVDNAPSGTGREIVASIELPPGLQIRYLVEPRIGLHHARHAGARAAQGEILVYIDDDVIAEPGWLSAVLQAYDDERVACVGGKSLPRWETTPCEWVFALHPGTYSLLDYGDIPRTLQWPEDLYGCNLSIRKSVLYEVGGFNPDGFGDRRLIWYRGDGETGLLRKVYAAGYKVIYTPWAVLFHRIPASRLTPGYVRRRAFDQSISHEYTKYRSQHTPPLGLGLGAGTAALRFLYHALKTKNDFWRRADTEWIKEVYMVSYYKAKVLYNMRLLMDAGLRKHVLQQSYLDNRPDECSGQLSR